MAAIQMLKDRGCKNIHFMCIIAAPEGVEAMKQAHPDVDMYIGALDEKLNDEWYRLYRVWEMPETEFSAQNKEKFMSNKMKYGKREDYISWDEYFMGVAQLSGMRSKDPHTQVGACIVSRDNKILSMGYNGFPCGCSDDVFPWEREGEELDTKYPFVTHSELNAILKLQRRFSGGYKALCIFISLQLMCQGDYSGGNQNRGI